jgi:hypothetical protein
MSVTEAAATVVGVVVNQTHPLFEGAKDSPQAA